MKERFTLAARGVENTMSSRDFREFSGV